MSAEHELSSPDQVTVSVRPLEERDLETADRIMRMAFGTFLGAPDPMLVFGDADYVYSRFAAEPSWAFGFVLAFAGSGASTPVAHVPDVSLNKSPCAWPELSV